MYYLLMESIINLWQYSTIYLVVIMDTRLTLLDLQMHSWRQNSF